MDYLLDTQAIIWFLNGDNRLSQRVQNEVKDVENTVAITMVSLWEIAIKRSIGKIALVAD